MTEQAPADGEAGVVAASTTPLTRAGLAADLRASGVRPGAVLLVHTALSRLGWVVGQETVVVLALVDVLGPAGTLVVPTQTGANSDPAQWGRPPVPESWWPVIREHQPAYDPATTPTRGMGRIPEAVRRWPGAVRSAHPQDSFAAIGPQAAALLARHELECRFGDGSPLEAMERAGAEVLLLGAGYDSCTAFHLAETRVAGAPVEEQSCAVATADGGRRWVTYTDVVADASDFEALGAAWDAAGEVRHGRVGAASTRLFALEPAVAYAAGWISEHRPGW